MNNELQYNMKQQQRFLTA